MAFLIIDFETRSEAEIIECGLHNYSIHPSTLVLFMGSRFVKDLGDRQTPTELWEPHLGPMPNELFRQIKDPTIDIIAHNSAFERYIFEHTLGIKLPASRFQDTQASARYLSLPASLDDVGMVLGLPMELRKDKRGEQLMDLFSFPKTRKKKEGSGIYFNDWNSHPAEWIEYGNYCKQDCVAEQEVARREVLLGAFPLSERERNIWIFDQKVNDRGIPVDVKFVRNMYELGSRSKKEAVDKQNELTGLENANSPIQMLAWAKTQGYKPGTLNKTTVEAQLKYHRDTLTPLAIEVLEARKAASSTTYKKLATVLRQVSPDSRLRNALVYMGSARCGRWSSAAVQIHNLSRSGIVGGYNFEDEEIMNEARDMVYNMDYEGIQEKYGSVLLVVKNLIRTVFSL